jgi:hypothetical protein
MAMPPEWLVAAWTTPEGKNHREGQNDVVRDDAVPM